MSKDGDEQGVVTADGSAAPGANALPPPPMHWTDKHRTKLKEGSRRRRSYDAFFLPVAPPTYFTDSKTELVKKLAPKTTEDIAADDRRAKEILDEAQALYDGVDDRIAGAQTRATTLQGAAAVAASLVIAGGALLADPSKVQGSGWRLWLALALFGTVFSLVMAGVRALAATSRIHVFHHPTPTDILTRAAMPLGQARIELAVDLLKNYGSNTQIASWKVAHLRAAAWWFRWALGFVVALALALGSYAVLGPEAEKSEAKTSTSTGATGVIGTTVP